MILSSKNSIINFKNEEDTVNAIIETSNQSIKKQPLLWLIHGSGGYSSSEELWKRHAHKHNCTTVIIDSYSCRGVYKQNWDGKDTVEISSYKRSSDIICCYQKILEMYDNGLLKYIDPTINVFVGFSYGATSVVRLASDTYKDKTNFVSWPVYACYPAFQNQDEHLYKTSPGKVHIFHGERDNWCLATNAIDYAQRTGNTIDVYPGVHHSFCKPGVKETHVGIPNGYGDDGVYAEYNERATKKSMSRVFRHLKSVRA